MNTKDMLAKWNEYESLTREIEGASAAEAAVRRRTEEELSRRFDTLTENVSRFCGGESFRSVVRDFCYLYPNVISVTPSGDLAYGRMVPPVAECSADRAVAVAEEAVRAVKTAVRNIAARSGDVNTQLRILCQGFATLRRICARVPQYKSEALAAALAAERQRIAGLKAARQEILADYPDFADRKRADALLHNAREAERRAAARFDFSDMQVASDYAAPVSLPIAKAADGSIVTWTPEQEGLLFVKDDGANDETTVELIKGVIMQFLYAYPAADKQVLYASMQADSDMDVLLSGMKETLEATIFFRGMQQVDEGDFDREIADVCQALREEIKERLLLLSKSGKRSLVAYNAANPKNVQKPILVVLKGYPDGFDYAKNLQYLFSNGARAGVYFLITGCIEVGDGYRAAQVVDASKFSTRTCELSMGEMMLDGTLHTPVALQSHADLDGLLAEVAESCAAVKKEIVSYEDVGFGSFSGNNVLEGNISIPVGMRGNDPYYLNFASSGKGNYPIAYLLLGLPKMGKSSLIDSMIVNGAMTYSPDDLTFYLLDFKDGIGSDAYTGKNAIPHVRVVAENNKAEDAGIILSSLLAEMERRNRIFKTVSTQNIDAYNRLQEKHMPRIVIVVDECQTLFEDDGLVKKCEDIVRKGRSAGIHLVMATQKLTSQMMTKVGEFMDGRFCFRVGAESAETLISRENAKNAPLLEVGVALASTDNGMHCESVRMSWHADKLAEYNRIVREKWQAKGYGIQLAIAGERGALTVGSLCERGNVLTATPKMEIPVVQNYFDHSLISLDFAESAERGKKNSLLVLGKNEHAAEDMLTAVIAGAMRTDATVKVIDAGQDQTLSHRFASFRGVTVRDADKYMDVLGEVIAEVRTRAANIRGQYKPYFLVLHCLNKIIDYAENTKKTVGGAPAAPASPAAQVVRDENGRRVFDFRNKGASNAQEVSGHDTLIEIIKKIANVRGVFVIISASDETEFGSSSDCAVLKTMSYKLLDASVGETVSKLMDNTFRYAMLKDMAPSMVMLAHSGSYVKARYLQFENNAATKALLDEAAKGE